MTKVRAMRRVVVLFRSRQRRLLAIAFIVIVTSGLIVVNPLLITPVFLWLTIRIGNIRRTTASCTPQTMADLATLSPETVSVSGVLGPPVVSHEKSSIRAVCAGQAPQE